MVGGYQEVEIDFIADNPGLTVPGPDFHREPVRASDEKTKGARCESHPVGRLKFRLPLSARIQL
jgi:hypothetical protein